MDSVESAAGLLFGQCVFEDGNPAANALVQLFVADATLRRRDANYLPGVNLRVTDAYYDYVTEPRRARMPIASVVSDRDGAWALSASSITKGRLLTAQLVDMAGLRLQAASRFVNKKWSQGTRFVLRLRPVDVSTSPLPPRFSSNSQTIYYATGRKRVTEIGGPTYANEIGDGTLAFGKCDVEMDKLHRVFWTELPPATATADLQRAVGMSSPHELLLFVHGFNVDFVAAARTTAELSRGTGRVALLLDWPSAHAVAKYNQDEDYVQAAVLQNYTIIRDLAGHIGGDRMVVLAHSMGSRLVFWIMALLSQSAVGTNTFKAVAIAAGDIFVDVVKPAFPIIKPVAAAFDNYASSRDIALFLSKLFHIGSARLGQTKPMTLVNGMVAIDASTARTDWLGHGYFSDPMLVDDLKALYDGKPVGQRRHLSAKPGKGYYTFKR
jgi:esterase/lipase superfamily enzyme